MGNKVGVMQGRLLPKYKNRYQAHPVGYWQEEFPVAASLGLRLIEFIVDIEDIEINPMMSASGISKIKEVCDEQDMGVMSICADCFMGAPLHSRDPQEAQRSMSYLRRLIINADLLKATEIVIPCVDQSSLQTNDDIARFVAALDSVRDILNKSAVNLSLETDLDPESFVRLLELVNSPNVKVNYDTGNSAAKGYNPREELSAYGHLVSDIHIKDRVRGGGSVPLGTGDTDFDGFFDALRQVQYVGPFIMQAYRDDEGVKIFREQLEWIHPYIKAYSKTLS